MTYGAYFLISLLFTVLIEVPLLWTGLKIVFKKEALLTKNIIFWGILANLFSFPYLWFVFPLFFKVHQYIYLGEITVVIIEAIILMAGLRISIKKAFIASLVANTASYYLGLILLKFI